jgi:serine/threonine-protein kinase
MAQGTPLRAQPALAMPDAAPVADAETTDSFRAIALPSPSARIYRSGDVIDERYRLVRPLGSGGMGVVWLAHSLFLRVDVAIKLPHGPSMAAYAASRMAREAHAAARLGHPATARVLDLGTTSRGDPFLAMELLHGESLRAILRRDSRLSPRVAVQLLLPVLDGLRAAHQAGIVHRDIKPDNIFIARDALRRRQPKLLDFGLAKLDMPSPVREEPMTLAGTTVGTPDYMAPEQAMGLELDGRADVWSVCVVLYECISGGLPWQRGGNQSVMRSVLRDAVVPTTLLHVGDAELWRVLERGLHKDAVDRWASVAELGEALARWLYTRGVTEDACGGSLRALWLEGSLPDNQPSARSGASAAKHSRARVETERVRSPRPAEQADRPLARAPTAAMSARADAWPRVRSLMATVATLVLGIALGAALFCLVR